MSKRKDTHVRYYVRSGKIYLDYALNGKRTQKSTGLVDNEKNIKLVVEKLIPKIEAEITLGVYKKKAKTFDYFAEQFLQEKSKQKSYFQKEYVYKKVIEHFSSFKIENITRNDVKRYLNSLEIKRESKAVYLLAIRGILDIALDDESIKQNVCVGIKLEDEAKEKDVKIFSKDEIKILLEKSSGLLRGFLAISFFTGMRAGEVLGLKQEDISENYINVKRSISDGRITTPKTKTSIRKIPILSELRPYLEELRNSKSFYLLQYDGRNIRDVGYFKRMWKSLIKECDIPYKAIKNTRHTFATMMLNSGKFKVMDIARILGHNSPRMILTVYSGFIEAEIPKIESDFSLLCDKSVTVDKNIKVSKVV